MRAENNERVINASLTPYILLEFNYLVRLWQNIRPIVDVKLGYKMSGHSRKIQSMQTARTVISRMTRYRQQTAVEAADLRNVDSGPEQFKMFPHLLWFVLGVEYSQLCEDAHVSTLQT